MKRASCLRLARQSIVVPWACRTAFIPGRWSSPGVAGVRSRSTESGASARVSRFSEAQVDSEHQSSFKRHREAEFQNDESSDTPYWPVQYPRIEDSTMRKSVPEFLKAFHEGPPSEPVVLMGRVRRKRSLGKNLVFFDIVNEFQKVQVMVNRTKCLPSDNRSDRFILFKKMIQAGDHISVTGVSVLAGKNEPTLEATQLPELLSPAMQQIPEHLDDAKVKALDRHVDMLVNKESVDILRLRAGILKYMRDHFQSKRFLEFQTPILAENAGGAIARPFVTRATGFGSKDLALRIAPELWLKRLVVGGIDRVFEIGPSFRNEGIDATHNPEFTTCEFYSAYSNLSDLINETEELIFGLAKHAQEVISNQLTTLPPIDLSRFERPFKQVEFIPGLENAMGMRLPNLSGEEALPELLAVLKLRGVSIPGEAPTSLHKLLDRLATMYLEPESFNEPIFITHHPACMSPLAKSFLCPKTYQLVSARAELFVGGRELANMYEEENNPKEQERKLNAHRSMVNLENGDVGFESRELEAIEEHAVETSEEKTEESSAPSQDDDGEAAPLDQSFVRALEYGLPPTGGWGCGVDRLVMLFSGTNRISDCLSFGTLRSVVNISSEANKRRE